jgi:hypothetical protein
MALTASPFHPSTGELLPSYRDAYLRGDLSVNNTELVDAYLKANPTQGTETFNRFHALKNDGHSVRPVGWLQHQFHLIRTEPARFRQRAGVVMLAAALVSGAVFAGNTLPAKFNEGGTTSLVTPTEVVGADLGAGEATAAAARMTTVNGRILDENGHPLVGATILDKASGRGVSTDAQGKYSLAVPANRAAQLQFGYGGYTEEEVQVKGHSVQDVTLLPRVAAKKNRWWPF